MEDLILTMIAWMFIILGLFVLGWLFALLLSPEEIVPLRGMMQRSLVFTIGGFLLLMGLWLLYGG